MSAPPIARFSSVVALTSVSFAWLLATAGGGCSLNTTGIADPNARVGAGGDVGSATRGGLGGNSITTVLTGSGGSSSDGGGASATGGAPGDDSATGGGPGTVSGAGGTQTATGGTSGGDPPGTGGAPGIGGTSGIGGASGVGGARGTGGAPGTGGAISVSGCADGLREAFTNVNNFPSIAGCAGGWSIPGVLTPASLNPACNRAAGNDGTRPNGNGCTVADLCAVGWHVCLGANELDTLNVTCNNAGIPAANGAATRVLYATRQHGVQGTTCNANDVLGTNDVHGCGNFGLAEDPNCAPLDRQFSHTECDQVAPWSCNDPILATTEALVVVKPGPAGGGVLCCR